MPDLQLFAVNTGSFALDGGGMFGRVPKALWEKQYPADARNRIQMALRCLLVKWRDGGGQRSLLVDAGIGDHVSEKNRAIFDVRLNPDAWRDAGARPEEVTEVLLTHLHFDHCGGATRVDAASQFVPAFPRAKYFVGKDHLAYSRQPSLDRGSFWPENYAPLDAAGVLNLVEAPASPWPNIELLQFNGHTRGLTVPLVRAGKKTVLFAGDLIPTRCHVRLAWIMAYDICPHETLKEKHSVLSRAADERWGLVLDHDIEAEVVTVKRDKEDFAVERTWTLEEFLRS